MTKSKMQLEISRIHYKTISWVRSYHRSIHSDKREKVTTGVTYHKDIKQL